MVIYKIIQVSSFSGSPSRFRTHSKCKFLINTILNVDKCDMISKQGHGRNQEYYYYTDLNRGETNISPYKKAHN